MNDKALTPEEADRRRWNVPNWKKAEDYRYVEDFLPHQLRWEFLRRTKAYREIWTKQDASSALQFELTHLIDPAIKIAPEHEGSGCRIIKFNKSKITDQILHYECFRCAGDIANVIFSVDLYSPVGPQLDFIREIHDKRSALRVSPEEKRKRDKRKNNRNGRTPEFLLRVLDGHNEKASSALLAEILGSEEGISESAMKRTITHAKTYWRRF